MQFESWIVFCGIALVATATPGPAALLVSANSLAYGVQKSFLTIAGNVTGLFVMSLLSVLGLSAIVLHSSIAFALVKMVGAIYLVYMGIKLWNNGFGSVDTEHPRNDGVNSIGLYFQGVLVALTNPKAILFTTALFPQFIIVSEPLLPQFSLLVASFMFLSFCCLGFYASFSQKVRAGGRQMISKRMLGKLFGSTFIGAGIALAMAQKQTEA